MTGAVHQKVQELKDKVTKDKISKSIPIIDSITASATSVSTGGVITVTCVAHDPLGQPLQYAWSANTGSVQGTGATVTYTAPGTPQQSTVTCTVSNGTNAASARVSVYVGVGMLKWKYQTGGAVSSPAIGDDGTIYVWSSDGRLHAITPQGIQKWEVMTGVSGSQFNDPMIDDQGVIYIGGNHNLYAINPSGTIKWQLNLGDNTATPSLGRDGTIYVGNTTSHNLFAINPSTGGIIWSTTVNMRGSQSLCVIGKDGNIIISGDNVIYAGIYSYDTNGSRKWNLCKYQGYTFAIGKEGTIISLSGAVDAIDPSNGTIKWSTTTYAMGCAAVDNGAIYFCGSCGYSFDAFTGVMFWQTVLSGYTYNTTPLLGDNDKVYLSRDTILFCLDSRTGLVEWQYLVDNRLSSPSIDSSGTVYIGSSDGNLYAIQGGACWRIPHGQNSNMIGVTPVGLNNREDSHELDSTEFLG